MADGERGEQAADPGTLDPAVLLQIGTTIAGIAVALATLTRDEDALADDFQEVSLALLLVGLVSTYASLYAMAALWHRAGISSRDILAGHETDYPHLPRHTYQALIVSTWGLWFLAGVYVIMLYATIYPFAD